MIIVFHVILKSAVNARMVISSHLMGHVFHAVLCMRTAAYVIPVHARHVMTDIMPPVLNVYCVPVAIGSVAIASRVQQATGAPVATRDFTCGAQGIWRIVTAVVTTMGLDVRHVMIAVALRRLMDTLCRATIGHVVVFRATISIMGLVVVALGAIMTSDAQK